MKSTHKGFTRGYIRTSKAYYAYLFANETVKVSVGMYHPEGGTSGEFEFEWVQLNKKTYARLKSCEDSWSALWEFKDLLKAMSEIDDQNIQEPEFCKLLDGLGIIDMTEYEQK